MAVIEGKVPYAQLSTRVWIELVSTSFLNFVCMQVTTTANQRADPVTVQLIMYLSVFYNWLSDQFFFGIKLDGIQYLGVCLTVVSCLAYAVYQYFTEKK